MMRGWAGTLLIVSALLGIPAAASADVPGKYVWPLAGYTNISGGFCDWRPRHYHGGIDISTEGQEGLRVRAADSGWVMRVSTSYWGYGKAVYLKMSDGRIAVYGHLSAFAAKIQAYVEQEQYASRRYQQNLFPAPGELPIKRGEIIARTGQTGGGPPHLHFEVRTGANRPLNPLVAGFTKPDKTPPRFHSVTIVPYAPAAVGEPAVLVNGAFAAKTVAFENSADGSSLVETPVVTGPVGLSVLVDDGVDGRRWSLSPYRIRAYVNDHLLAEVRYDSIEYAHSRLIDLERRIDPRPGLAPRPVNLFLQEGNVLWHYVNVADSGRLLPGTNLIPGANVVRLEAEDVAGNRSEVEFGLMLVDAEGAFSGAGDSFSPDSITCRAAGGGLAVRLPAPAGGRPNAYRDEKAQQPLRGFATISDYNFWLSADWDIDSVWVAALIGGTTSYRIPWTAVTARDGGMVVSEDSAAQVSFGPDELFRSTFFRFREVSLRKADAKPALQAYELLPADAGFARDVRLTLSYAGSDKDRTQMGIYRYRGARGWDFEGANLQPETETIRATISAPGTFAILRDTLAPTIRNVKPGRGQTTARRRPVIRFQMFDDLSGIGSDKDVLLTIDGQWVPVEYDPEQKSAKARPRWDLPPGKHRVEISVKDRVGNEGTFLRILHVK